MKWRIDTARLLGNALLAGPMPADRILELALEGSPPPLERERATSAYPLSAFTLRARLHVAWRNARPWA